MMSGVKANRIMKAKTSMAQAKIGMRLRVIPGARIFRMPMMISMAAAMAPTSATPRPSTQKSRARSGEYVGPLSGT